MLLSSVFIWEGIRQLADPSASVKYFARVHVPYPDIAIWVSIVINLGAGLALLGVEDLLGRGCARHSLPIHCLWRTPAGRRPSQHVSFLQEPYRGGWIDVAMVFAPGAFSVNEAMGTD